MEERAEERCVLRPVVPSWQRPAERRPWEVDDVEDPGQVAREAMAELYAAVKVLSTVVEMLAPAKPEG